MQALLLAAGFKVEDAHGSIIFLHHRTQPVQFWSMISGDVPRPRTQFSSSMPMSQKVLTSSSGGMQARHPGWRFS